MSAASLTVIEFGTSRPTELWEVPRPPIRSSANEDLRTWLATLPPRLNSCGGIGRLELLLEQPQLERRADCRSPSEASPACRLAARQLGIWRRAADGVGALLSLGSGMAHARDGASTHVGIGWNGGRTSCASRRVHDRGLVAQPVGACFRLTLEELGTAIARTCRASRNTA